VTALAGTLSAKSLPPVREGRTEKTLGSGSIEEDEIELGLHRGLVRLLEDDLDGNDPLAPSGYATPSYDLDADAHRLLQSCRESRREAEFLHRSYESPGTYLVG